MQATKETSGTRWPQFPLHPFLFAAYPVLFLYAQNAQGQVSPRELILPLVVSLAATLVVEERSGSCCGMSSARPSVPHSS